MRDENKMNGNAVYVLWWRYSDGSGAGVIRVYENKVTADEQKAMLEEHCDGMKRFELTMAPYSDN